MGFMIGVIGALAGLVIILSLVLVVVILCKRGKNRQQEKGDVSYLMLHYPLGMHIMYSTSSYNNIATIQSQLYTLLAHDPLIFIISLPYIYSS